MPQLASRYGIHPAQINSWKRHLVEQAAELFARSDGAGKDKGSIDDLHCVIGQLTVELAATVGWNFQKIPAHPRRSSPPHHPARLQRTDPGGVSFQAPVLRLFATNPGLLDLLRKALFLW